MKNERRKPSLTMEGTLPLITIPLTEIERGTDEEFHVAKWESYGLLVEIRVRAKRLEKPNERIGG
jgi:hypothetical protein